MPADPHAGSAGAADVPAPRYRVLVMAEAANPEWQSVPLIGWNLFRALKKVADAHLVTHVRNQAAIERAGLVEGKDFTSIDNEHVASPLHKLATRLRGGAGKGWTTLTAFSSLAYYSFELEVWRRFSARIVARDFDLVHRITPVSPTSQSLIAKRVAAAGVPFVIGPLNGGVPWPKNFSHRQHAEREWLSHIRSLYKLMPGYRSTRQFSAAIIVGSRFTYHDMPDWAKPRCIYIPENGVDPARFELPRVRSASCPLQLAFLGRLVPYKGPDILLAAIADFLRADLVHLHIIGDGPQRPHLEELSDRLQVRHRVHFHGWVAHADVPARLRECDCMVLPSIREFGGGAVVEAMALGVTPIVADYGGPSELVDDDTGIKVPFYDEASLTEGIRSTIERIIGSPSILERLGAAARRKVHDKLTWQSKAHQIRNVYRDVLSGSAALATFDYYK